MLASTSSTCRVFSKIFSIKKVISFPWLNQSPQLSRLSCCMSINTWPQRGFISSNNQSSQLQTSILTNNNNNSNINRCSTIDILVQRKWPHLRERSYGFDNRSRLYQENNLFSDNTSSLNNRISCRWFSTDDSSNKTTALTVISELKELKTAPFPALALGFSGLIPFVSVPVYIITTGIYMPDICFAQTAYGAVILSFLGGVRWGHAVSNPSSTLSVSWTSLGQSVIPSLIAWPALLLPVPFSTLVVAVGLGGLAYYDIIASAYAPWFKALRFVLSFIAVIALWSSIMCHLLMPQHQTLSEKKKNE